MALPRALMDAGRQAGLCALLLLCCASGAQQRATAARPHAEAANVAEVADAARGRRLFLGREGVVATLQGDTVGLPVAASRCVNCHSAAGSDSRPGTALVLDRAVLLVARARRGAPAFVYDIASFCDTLRTGIDRQHVVLERRMPRYALTSQQCVSLWIYLTAPASL